VPTYLYGLIQAADAGRLPLVTGLQGDPVRSIRCGTLAALVSSVDSPLAGTPPDLDSIRRHDAVLRAVVEGGVTVVPIRFAQTFDDGEDPCRYLVNREHLARLLDEFAGCVEMHIVIPATRLDWARIEGTAPRSVTDDTSGPGREYLERLRETMRPYSPYSLKSLLGPTIIDEALTMVRDGSVASFAHLIRSVDVAAYRRAVEGVPGLVGAQVIGPLALHAFSGIQ
jgi:hypothetical protein